MQILSCQAFPHTQASFCHVLQIRWKNSRGISGVTIFPKNKDAFINAMSMQDFPLTSSIVTINCEKPQGRSSPESKA
jgi:hypothetical protein